MGYKKKKKSIRPISRPLRRTRDEITADRWTCGGVTYFSALFLRLSWTTGSLKANELNGTPAENDYFSSVLRT